jgi:large subunit ribosomal protein L23
MAKSNSTTESTSKQVSATALFLYPRISEKSARLADRNKYVFNVPQSSNKVEIKKAVERTYKVKVLQVNVVNNQGKQVNFGRFSGKRSGFKKAIVTLREGDKIEFSPSAGK